MFQSTRPVWGATAEASCGLHSFRVSIHAPRVGRDLLQADALRDKDVSIHAPRVGRDSGKTRTRQRKRSFNPRAPCGARRAAACGVQYILVFQSTRPVWGATVRPLVGSRTTIVSIHAPRVGRDDLVSGKEKPDWMFQSTRPVWGATFFRCPAGIAAMFQSTRPVWGATTRRSGFRDGCIVSIHAPRVGRDLLCFRPSPRNLRFNPRAPCGARPLCKCAASMEWMFQSTRPVWGATPFFGLDDLLHFVSIHAPRVGRDRD